MILGIGCDLIESSRLRDRLQSDADFLSAVFTPAEIAYCDAMRYPARHYAARFAAKEALLKALGTGLRGAMSWLDMEVRSDESGAVCFRLCGATRAAADLRGVTRAHLSLSHTDSLAAAYVVLEAHPNPVSTPKEPSV